MPQPLAHTVHCRALMVQPDVAGRACTLSGRRERKRRRCRPRRHRSQKCGHCVRSRQPPERSSGPIPARLHADECPARLSPGCDPAPFARHPRLDTLGPTLRPSRLPIPSPWPALTAGRGPDPAPRLASPRARASPPGSCDALRADGCARRRSRLFSRRRWTATSPASPASWRRG